MFGAIWYCASWATSVNNKITELEKDIETIRLQLDRLSNVKDDVIELKAQIKSFDKIVNILFIQPSLNSALSKGLIKEGSYHITEQGEKIIPNNLKERIKQIVEKNPEKYIKIENIPVLSLLDHIGYDSILEIAETNNLSTDEVVAVIIVYANNIAKEKIANTTIPPIVQIRPIKDEAWVGELCILEVFIMNPIFSPDGKNLTAQIILKVPPNVVAYGGETFTISGSGQYVAVFKNVSPGDAVYQRVYVKGLEAGEYNVSADLIWYYEGEQTPHIKSSSCAVKFFAIREGTSPQTEIPLAPPPTMFLPLHPLIVLTVIIIAIVYVVARIVRVLK